MRKLFALFILIMACFLVACSVSFNDPESENPQGKDSNEVEIPEKKEVEAETAKKEEGEDEDEIETVDEKIVFDPEPVFIKMVEASKSINHVLMNSDTKTTTTEDGSTDEEITTVVGEIQVESFAQHILITAVSGDTIDSELYLVDDATYIQTEATDGWIVFHHRQPGGALAVLKQKHLDHLITFKDEFKLTDDGDRFILTYIGSDEMYKEVVYAGLMEADKVTTGSMGNSKESDVRGTIKMTVSKDTYNIVALEAITDVTTYGSVETNVVNDSLSTFSSFNEIDEITVPKEVVDDAMPLNPGL